MKNASISAFSWTDTLELKLQIEKMLGYLRAQKYVDLLTKFLSLKVNKSDFDRLCTGTVGRENVLLHNLLLRSIIKEAQFFKTLPTKESKAKGDLSGKVPNRYKKVAFNPYVAIFSNLLVQGGQFLVHASLGITIALLALMRRATLLHLKIQSLKTKNRVLLSCFLCAVDPHALWKMEKRLIRLLEAPTFVVGAPLELLLVSPLMLKGHEKCFIMT